MSNTLDRYDNLLIRACKGNGNTLLRLRKIAAMRARLSKSEAIDGRYDDGIALILLDILQKRSVGTVDIGRLLSRVSPDDARWVYGHKTPVPYWHRVLEVLATEIRHTAPREWSGFHKSLYWRNKDKTD